MNYLTYKPTVEEYNRYCPRWKKVLDLTIDAVVFIGVIWGAYVSRARDLYTSLKISKRPLRRSFFCAIIIMGKYALNFMEIL